MEDLPALEPARPGRRRQRLSDEVIRHRMLHAGRQVLGVDGGLTVSLDHLSFEEVIQSAAVSRSAAYRLWPYKDEFYDELLLNLAGPEWAGASIFDLKTVELARDIVDRHADMLSSIEGRTKLLVLAAREGAEHNFRAVSGSPQWRTYIALTSTIVSMPSGPTKQKLVEKMREADDGFLSSMATFYEEILRRVGIQLRPEFNGDYRMLAALGASVVEGLAIRRLVTPELTDDTFRSTYYSSFGSTDWTLPSLGFTAVLMAMVEPDPNF